jgi:hypothetical protein
MVVEVHLEEQFFILDVNAGAKFHQAPEQKCTTTPE